MNIVRSALREVAALFFDDLWYAGAILVWIAACAFIAPFLGSILGGIVLVAGLCAILLAGVYHSTMSRR